MAWCIFRYCACPFRVTMDFTLAMTWEGGHHLTRPTNLPSLMPNASCCGHNHSLSARLRHFQRSCSVHHIYLSIPWALLNFYPFPHQRLLHPLQTRRRCACHGHRNSLCGFHGPCNGRDCLAAVSTTTENRQGTVDRNTIDAQQMSQLSDDKIH